MMTIFKFLLPFIFLSFCTFQSSAQSIWEVELDFGRAEYQGDVSSEVFSQPSFFNSIKLGLRYNFHPSWAFNGNFNPMILTGSNDAFQFHTQIIEWNAIAEWFPFRGQGKYLNLILQPYLYTGLGVASQKTTYSSILTAIPPNSSIQSDTFVPIHLGAGLRILASRKLGFTFSSTWRYTGVDNLDAVILGDNNDWYFDANIGVLLFLNKRNVMR